MPALPCGKPPREPAGRWRRAGSRPGSGAGGHRRCRGPVGAAASPRGSPCGRAVGSRRPSQAQGRHLAGGAGRRHPLVGAPRHHPQGHHQGHHPLGHHPLGHHPQGHHPLGDHPQGHHPQGHHPQGHHPLGHHPRGTRGGTSQWAPPHACHQGFPQPPGRQQWGSCRQRGRSRWWAPGSW